MAANLSGKGMRYEADGPGAGPVLFVPLDAPTTESAPSNTTNCSNDYCVSDEEYVDMIWVYLWPDPFEWGLIVFYILVFTVGLVGNFLVCLAVWRNQHMRTVTNYFIVNLAVADFLVILVCLPPTLLGDVTETWYMGKAMCKAITYLQVVSVSVSVLTLIAISLERYYAICHPLKFAPTTRRARLLIVAIWGLAMSICLPELIVLDVQHKYPDVTVLLSTCKPQWADHSQMAYQLFLIVALYFLPILVMGAAYIRIAVVLWSNYIPTETRHIKSMKTINGRSPTEHQMIARRKAAKMLIAVVVMFAVCYLPVHLLNILRYAEVDLSDNTSGYFALVSHWLPYFNSAVNPIIYNFMSEKFQKAFAAAMSCAKVDPRSAEWSRAHISQSPRVHHTRDNTPIVAV